jgi:hypothetical protein
MAGERKKINIRRPNGSGGTRARCTSRGLHLDPKPFAQPLFTMPSHLWYNISESTEDKGV